jgi:hypothetical protein
VSLRKFWTFFGGIFFGTGLIVLLVGLYATYHAYGDAERLSQEGQVAEGIVLERKIETHQGAGRNAGPTQSYSLVYRFTTADGQTFTAEVGVDRATWNRLVERSPVRILYVPGAPGINALAGHEPVWVFALIAPLVGLILSALGGFVLMRVRRQGSDALASDEAAQSTRRHRRSPGTASDRAQAVDPPTLPPRTRRVLLLVGAICLLVPLILLGLLCEIAYEGWRYAHDGTTTSCAVTGKSIEQADASRNRSTRYLAHCHFATAAGETLEGHYALPVAAWELLTPGSTLAITYLPADHGRSRLAGDGFSAETAGLVLLILIPLAAVFSLVGVLSLQRARRRPWRELWWSAGMRPSVVLATAARRFLRLGLVGLALLAYLIVSLLLTAQFADTAAIRAVDRFVEAHRLWLLLPAIPLGILGFILFLGSGLVSAMAQRRPLSREELDDFYRAQGRRDPTDPGLGWRWQMGIDDGTAIATRDPIVGLRLADLKYAWRAGLLRRPPFPRRIAHLAGALMLLLGGGGAIFAIGSGLMRIWVVLWVLLALGLIARALAKR